MLPPASVATPSSLATNGAVVADLTGIGAPQGGKKKFAAIGFALVGVLAIGGAVIAFTQSKPSTQTPAATNPTPSATQTVVAPLPTAPTTKTPTTQATQAASAAPSSTQSSTKTNIGGGVTITTKNPTTKSTGTTKSNDNLPHVRDPGF
jgi:cytoskeletal protein RodZ